MRIVHSPFGQVLIAIKENEPRAISLGYDTDRFKLLAFVLSAGLAGLAGSLKVLVLGFETLGDAYWTMSGLVMLMTLVGGMSTMFGPLLGAAIIVALEDRLGDIGSGARADHGRRLVQFARRIGDDRDGHDLHRVRAGVPARDRRRDHRAGAAAAG